MVEMPSPPASSPETLDTSAQPPALVSTDAAELATLTAPAALARVARAREQDLEADERAAEFEEAHMLEERARDDRDATDR
jgi:hypothetical protein